MSSPLERAVEVLDRLRSPGGCPWDAVQTHRSLTRYLVEETYEVLEAIETDDVVLLREELGDLLLQVLFHARLAAELPPGQAFGIDEVADDLVDKLVRRHPHVFARADAGATSDDAPVDAEAVNESWEAQKVIEKGRTSVVDGIAPAQPALALAAKLVTRARRAGLHVEPLRADGDGAADRTDGDGAEDAVGRRLLAVVAGAVDAGVDPETALRRTARAYRAALVTAEQAGRPAADR